MMEIVKTKARVGMALALADYVPPMPKNGGKMNGLMGQLKSQCIKRLSYMIGRRSMLSEHEKIVRDKMGEFGKATGWEGKEKHLATYIAFLLALFDKYPESGIIGALNDISAFLEQGGKSPRACMPAGVTAFDKWERIWGDE